MKPPLFDPSQLPPARCTFALLSDTHYMLDVGNRPLEFESRRRQTARTWVALRLAAGLGADFAVHLGDLVQEYPDTPDFDRALDEALDQLRDSGLALHHVAGNHDVGDKPDTTMPTHPVDACALDAYHRRFGPSRYSFDREDLHFAFLNSQIMNTGLPQEQQQRDWLTADLEQSAGRRLFLFLHLPPFLCAPDEPHLGHYDNLGEPARSWLLERLHRHRVEILFAGHVHFPFEDRIGRTRIVVLPSPSFTRPGFGHLFVAGPPPEQGRDDRPKLGFYLCRVLDDRVDLHFVRTGGATRLDTATRLLTRTPAGLPQGALGLTLLHPLATAAEVPLAWPSAIRQPVRNDLPFLACRELGAIALRLPWTDAAQPLQSRRLSLLRTEGVHLQAFLPAGPDLDLHALLDQHPGFADTWELQLAGTPWPSEHILAQLRDGRRRTRLALSTLLPGQRVPGKQHPRTRIGYRPDELLELDRRLEEASVTVDAALCRIDAEPGPWETARALGARTAFARIGRVDWLLSLPGLDDTAHQRLVAEALFATLLTPGARLYLDPLIDLDRTMDVRHGLLDTLCNPRSPFPLLRGLNTLLHPFTEERFAPEQRREGDLRILHLAAPATALHLLLPEAASPLPADLWTPGGRLYHLPRGTVAPPQGAPPPIDGPALLIAPR